MPFFFLPPGRAFWSWAWLGYLRKLLFRKLFSISQAIQVRLEGGPENRMEIKSMIREVLKESTRPE